MHLLLLATSAGCHSAFSAVMALKIQKPQRAQGNTRKARGEIHVLIPFKRLFLWLILNYENAYSEKK